MRVAALLVLVAVAACDDGTDLPADCERPAPPTGGQFSRPADFPTGVCEPGALVGVDLVGPWYARPTELGFFGSGPVAFQQTCAGLAVPNQHTEVTDDYVFWSREFGGTYRESYMICRAAGGALFGTYAHCDESCFTQAVELSRFDWIDGESAGDKLELVASFAGDRGAPWSSVDSRNVRVHKGIAYVLTKLGLRIVDVSRPRAPADLGFYPAFGEALNDIKIVDSGPRVYAVIASNTLGAVIVDVTHPAQPLEVRRFAPSSPPRGGHTVFTETVDGETWAYFINGTSAELDVFDLADPTNPRVVGRYYGPDLYGYHDLYVENRIAYINGTFDGLVIVDMNDPAHPVALGSVDTHDYSHSNWVTTVGDRRISVHGGEGGGSTVQLIDVDPASPQFLSILGSFALREEVSVHNIMAFGDRAYVAYYQNGVRVLDLSDPSNPTQVGYYNTWDPSIARGEFFEGAFGLDVDRAAGLIYVADSESGLVILRER